MIDQLICLKEGSERLLILQNAVAIMRLRKKLVRNIGGEIIMAELHMQAAEQKGLIGER